MPVAGGMPVKGADGAAIEDAAGICSGLTARIVPYVFTHRLTALFGFKQAVPA